MAAILRNARLGCISALVCFSFVAITAPNAQAGEFWLNEETFKSAGVTSESIAGTVNETEFSVAWLGFAITCSGATFNGVIFQGGSLFAQATFEECAVNENPFCTVSSPGVGEGEIGIEGSGELVLHAEQHYGRFESEEFTVLYMQGPFCSLPEEMIASGSAAMKVPFALEKLVNQAFAAVTGSKEGALLGVGVQCAGEPAAILGSEGSIHLSGANAGEPWGFE